MTWDFRSIRFALLIFSLVVVGIAHVEAQGNSSRRSANSKAAKTDHSKSDDSKSGDSETAKNANRPNIILINLDDADVDLFSDELLDQYLPNIKSLATGGMRFTNCHVTTPLCGPSRACLLRGQHAHRTGIKTNLETGALNRGFTGAYDVFKKNGFEQEHVGVWMQRSGYRTMMIGKYLHGRMDPTDLPGWDDLFMCFGGAYYKTSRYSSRLPLLKRRGQTGADEYRSVVEADEAVGMIEAQHQRNGESKKDQPFFLYIAPLAPHLPARLGKMLQKEYEDEGKEIRIPSTPDFNEADISDKPSFLRNRKLNESELKDLNNKFRERVMATKSVDDMVGRLVEVLDRLKLRDNTYVFFTSDHGYQLGHSRMIAKKLPYHRNTIVPMFVTGPKVKQGSSGHLLAHIDLAATFLDIANAKAPVELDGKSWLPILSRPDQIGEADFRKSLLIQNWETKSQVGKMIPACYASLRTIDHQIFTEWSSGAYEYYDLMSDPYQLVNKINSLSAVQMQSFIGRLHDTKQGLPIPIVTIANPGLVGRNLTIQGVAEDDHSVDKVDLEILDATLKLYWDGQSWQQKKSAVAADLANPHGLVSDWSYPIDMSAIKHDGKVNVVARAYDHEGRVSQEVKATFQVDGIAPETVLVKPVDGAELESPVMIRGECSDNDKLVGVEITLHRIDDNMYWNGQKWTQTKSTFFKRAAKKLWHIVVEVPSGKYQTSVRALDGAGNYDPSPCTAEFSIK